MLGFAFALLERGLLPDFVTRFGVRNLLESERIRIFQIKGVERIQEQEEQFVADLRRVSAIALETDAANEQHYEVPTSFFQLALGPRLKYSSCEFATPSTTLAQAEEATFSSYAKKARLEDGMRFDVLEICVCFEKKKWFKNSILDVGCGWGSLTLWLLERFPNTSVYSVSNSATQRAFIEV